MTGITEQDRSVAGITNCHAKLLRKARSLKLF